MWQTRACLAPVGAVELVLSRTSNMYERYHSKYYYVLSKPAQNPVSSRVHAPIFFHHSRVNARGSNL